MRSPTSPEIFSPRRDILESHAEPEKKDNGLKPKLQTVVLIAVEEETCPPARLDSLSPAASARYAARGPTSTPLEYFRAYRPDWLPAAGLTAALRPALRFPLREALLELRSVGVELGAVLRFERVAEIVPLGLEQLSALLALRRRGVPQILQSRRVATLTGLTRLLQLRLGLLAERLHLRGVLL